MILRIGVVSIVLSRLALATIAVLPLLEISSSRRVMYAGGLLVVAPVLFWGGLALVGRETWRTARRYGWRQTPRHLWRLLRHGDRERPQAAQSGDARS